MFFFRCAIWVYVKSLNGGPWSVVLFGSILLRHPKTINAKVVNLLNLYRLLNAVIKKLYNFDACEQPKDMKNQWRSFLIFKREAPKNARPRAFARFAQWLIRPWQKCCTYETYKVLQTSSTQNLKPWILKQCNSKEFNRMETLYVGKCTYWALLLRGILIHCR